MFNIKNSSSEIIVLDNSPIVNVSSEVNALILDDGNVSDRTFNVGEGAKIEILKIYRTLNNIENGFALNSKVSAGADLKMTAVILGNDNSEVELMSEVLDSKASSDINVVYFADNSSGLKVKVRNDFRKPNSTGAINVRGVAANESRIEVFGEIGIDQSAGGTDSRLDQHALIWGKGSKVRQLPILEINTNDVKAGHGATVSRIQDEELFYFLSRGIPNKVAYSLAINGFLSSLLSEISSFDTYYQEILKAIADKTKALAG